MNRLPRIISPNGHAKPEIPIDVRDGMADLRDFCIDPETNTSTTVAGEAISGLYRLYHLQETDKARQAYAALHRLRERNSYTLGQDIPINHAPVYKQFRDVVETLIYCLERDHGRALKQQGLMR